jgi:hypothetical protein
MKAQTVDAAGCEAAGQIRICKGKEAGNKNKQCWRLK